MKDGPTSDRHLELVEGGLDPGWIQQAVTHEEVQAWFNQKVTVTDRSVIVSSKDIEGFLELLGTRLGISEGEADQIFNELIKLKRAGQ